MSWFQLGVAYGDLGHSAQAIDAYEKALALDPDYDLAMFNLGGTYWNRGEKIEALAIWTTAIDRFPDHELAAKLQRDMRAFFSPQQDQPSLYTRSVRRTIGNVAASATLWQHARTTLSNINSIDRIYY